MNHCPTQQQLEQLLEEQLPDAEHQDVSVHVSQCSACQAALENLTSLVADSSLTAILGNSQTTPLRPEPLNPFLVRLKESSFVDVLSTARSGGRTPSPSAQAWTAARPGTVPTVPGYEIQSELGRGGMGVVYKATQLGLNRLVALKMILAGSHAAPRDHARFRQEAEAVAQLGHPNIVQVYDIGEADGIPYFALEYVEGGSLVSRLHGDPQPIDSAVRLIETLAQTVHFAHLRGIVHRDLKPANILLSSESKVLSTELIDDSSSGLSTQHSALSTLVPKITDFGLAKRLDEKSHGSQSGEIVGTPCYMAPEQASGRAAPVGPAADVYALGAILYEMLTGRPPFKGATPVDTVVQVLHEEPVRPSRLRPRLPADLETICLKCLTKEPARRYPSAGALADDLQRFRKGKPILARPVGPVERAWKMARRRPLTAALLVGMILSVILGFAGVTWQWQEAARARDIALDEKRDKETERLQAEHARAEAVEERKKTRAALYFSRIAQSQLQYRVNDVAGAVENLKMCMPLADHEDQRGWEWHYLLGLFHSDLLTLSHTHGGEGGCAVFAPDGKTLASVVSGQSADGMAAGEIRIWDAGNGALIQTRRTPGSVHRLAFRPDGTRLALATMDGRVVLWDTATGKELLRKTPHAQLVAAVAYSPDGQFIASASWDETVKILRAATGDVVRVLHPPEGGRFQCLAFQPDGKRLATGGWDGMIRLWDLQTGSQVQLLSEHKMTVSGVAFSPDGKFLASAGSNGNLRIWDLASGRFIQSVTARAGAVLSNAFSPDGRYLAYSGGDGTVRVWEVESGVERVIYHGHSTTVESVQFSPDGQRLVSACPLEGAVKVWDFTRHPDFATLARVRGRADQSIKVRDLTGRTEASTLARTGPDIEALAFHADGRHLVSVAVGGKLQTWDAFSGVLKQQRNLDLCDELISPAVLTAFSPGGGRLAGRTRADERLVKVWDVASGPEAITLPGHTLPVFCVRFSVDGRQLVTCGCDLRRPERPHEVKVWDTSTGSLQAAYTGNGLIFTAAFSPDGRYLILGAQDGGVLLAACDGRQRVLRLGGLQSHVAAAAFSSDGRLLAAAGVGDKALRIWNLDGFDPERDAMPRTIGTPVAPPFLCDLAFSPDGRRLAGINRDLVKMWDVETGHEVLSLRGAPKRYWDPAFNPRIAFSADGKRLVGTNWDESISMWDAGVESDPDAIARFQATRRQAADARAVFWHLQEAEDCVEHQERSAARFHLQRLENVSLPAPLEARKKKLVEQLAP
jgi:WD40 repeat protein/serine/threonine protein kinase